MQVNNFFTWISHRVHLYFCWSICCDDQQKTACFESDLCMSYISYIATIDRQITVFWPQNIINNLLMCF